MKSKEKKIKKSEAKQGLEASNLYLKYVKEIVPRLLKEDNYKGKMAVPRLTMIVINSGIGPWLEKEENVLKKIKQDLALICSQQPVFTNAKKSEAGFKIKIGQKVGLKVTLRGLRMYDFLERLIVEALPRIRDFRGISLNSFGEKGNINLGIKEHTVFAEIDSEKTDYVFSLGINIVNTAKNKQEGIKLMKYFGFPVRESEETGIVEELKSNREKAEEKEKKK